MEAQAAISYRYYRWRHNNPAVGLIKELSMIQYYAGAMSAMSTCRTMNDRAGCVARQQASCLYTVVVDNRTSFVSFYPRDAMLARVIGIVTCPSVTRRYCVKTKKASGMISSPSGSPKTLVFRRQISSPNFKEFPRTGASNKGRSEKFSDFLALSVNISKTVADTAKVTISD